MKNDDLTNMKNEEGSQNSNQGGISENTRVRLASKTARKEGMQKGVLTTAIIAFLLLAGVVIIGYSLYTKEQTRQTTVMENQKTSYTQQLTQRDSLLNEWMTTFDQIEKDLSSIKEKENIITIKSNDKEFTKDKRDQILKDIAYINTLLEANKKKIASLTAQLSKSGTTIKGLQDKVAELETSIKQRETEVSDLKSTLTQKDFQIGEMNTKMSEQEVTIQQKEETISTQTAELNKAYVASGTYKELKEKGLLSKEGGFLGLGRKEAILENFSDSIFKQIDITQTKIIPINSKDAKLITEHPQGSYSLVRDQDNKIASIEITNPAEFWKISKYAVVEIK